MVTSTVTVQATSSGGDAADSSATTVSILSPDKPERGSAAITIAGKLGWVILSTLLGLLGTRRLTKVNP